MTVLAFRLPNLRRNAQDCARERRSEQAHVGKASMSGSLQ